MEAFVRTNLVVKLAKNIKTCLLLTCIARRWLKRLVFERAVHALMSSVLLRLTRGDAFRQDPQADPPHRQLRKAANTDGGKRGTVIGADAFGQPVALKQCLEDLATLTGARARDDLASK